MKLKHTYSPAEIATLRNNPPAILSKTEASIVSTLSIRKLHDDIARGLLKASRVGTRCIIHRDDLLAYLGGAR